MVWFLCLEAYQPLWVSQSHPCRTKVTLFNTYQLGIMTFIHFPKESECNSQVEFKLDNYNVTIQHVSYYTMTILPSSIFNTAICLICKCLYLPNPSAIGQFLRWIRTIMNYLMLKFDWLISQVGRVFTNGSGDWGSISGRVIPKTQKMVRDTSLLNTRHIMVRIKGKVE